MAADFGGIEPACAGGVVMKVCGVRVGAMQLRLLRLMTMSAVWFWYWRVKARMSLGFGWGGVLPEGGGG